MEEQKWFHEEQKRNIIYFEPGENVGTLVKDYGVHFRKYSNAVTFVLKLMQDKTTDESELIATIYAVWNNCLIQKKELDETNLIKEVYEWSASKSRFTKKDIANTWYWMKEKKLIPHGWGKLIEKANL